MFGGSKKYSIGPCNYNKKGKAGYGKSCFWVDIYVNVRKKGVKTGVRRES